jgi:hypothetical protein
MDLRGTAFDAMEVWKISTLSLSTIPFIHLSVVPPFAQSPLSCKSQQLGSSANLRKHWLRPEGPVVGGKGTDWRLGHHHLCGLNWHRDWHMQFLYIGQKKYINAILELSHFPSQSIVVFSEHY